ncbi:MAG: glutamine-hydrolyzing carbamoyl-phosphate synthase small subunit [Saprospiraceae bacterium]
MIDTSSKASSAILMLQDGTIFRGESIGIIGTTTGELCFNTGMTGYQEVFTDPSYFGQLLISTNVHIGNYGTKVTESESESIKIAGLIVKNFTNDYSRVKADLSIQDYLVKERLVGIHQIDTRALVRHIRSKGAMNGIISSEIFDIHILQEKLEAIPDMNGLELASKVCTEEEYFLGEPNAKFKIAVMDFGTKRNILSNLVNRDCYLHIFPAKTPIDKVLSWSADGYFLSNGPGDPAAMDYAIQITKAILNTKKPTFGICLGHQILALALDIPTFKMHHGHRGINHPVKNLKSGKCEITSQNHGFCVDPEILRTRKDIVEITHVNLNDDTIEGIRLKNQPAFSVQYHPEASPGPYDAHYLFDQFIEEIEDYKKELN